MTGLAWNDDTEFMAWMCAVEYATEVDGKPVPYLTLGVVLYLHEAWVAGRSSASLTGRDKDALL